MLDQTDFDIFQGRLDINRLPKKVLLGRYKNLITQLMIISNTNTAMCIWLQDNHAEAWEELLNADLSQMGQPESDAIAHDEDEARMLDETHSDIRQVDDDE